MEKAQHRLDFFDSLGPAFAGLFPYVSAVLRRKRKFSNFFILELTERREIAIILKLYDSLAQLAEHLTFNQGVRSSNLRWVTKRVFTRYALV